MAEIWNNCRTFAPKLLIIMYTKTKKAFRTLLQTILPIVLMAVLLTSCLSESDDVSVGNNSCYISNVSFNSFRRLTTTKASDGVTDTTFYTTYTASNWVFTIDHKTLFIENRDSLPCNTDLSRVVMNLSYTAGLAYYRASDAWDDDPWIPYQSSDSIDIRKPLHIKLVATDNTERKYTLKINVHTMEGDTLRWVAVKGDDAISGAHPMKALSWNDEMSVMVNDGNAVMKMTHPLSNLGEWTRQVTDLPTTVDLTSLSKGPKNLFVSSTDGGLYSSADGLVWTRLFQYEGLRLVGVSHDKLYAKYNGVINSIYIGSDGWSIDPLDEDASFLPDEEIAAITYTQNENLTRMIIVGNRSVETDTCAVVWSKCWTDFEEEDTESWMHYSKSWDNTKPMPMFTQINMMYYDNKLMVVGGKSKDGKVEALERFYVSEDNGLTWWRLHTILPPADMHGADGYITSTVDDNNFIWLIADGKVYRGRLNRLGFARPDIF